MKPYLRNISGLLLICAVGVGATALPASAATVQPAQTAASDYHHPRLHGYGGPLSPAGLLACAENLGLPDPQGLVEEVLQAGVVHFSLEVLGEALAGNYLLVGEVAYPVFDFWFNCVAPYLPVSAATPPPPTQPSTPSSPGAPSSPEAPTPPFYTLGGGAG